jgi:flagella basal body P-ring formation protein FlgA
MNRIIFPLIATVGLASGLSAQPAPAQGLPPAQNLDQLEQIVVTTLGADIGQPGGPMVPIDRRMRLTDCPTGIQVDPPTGNAVTVRCTTAGWRLRVPLARASATVAQQGNMGARSGGFAQAATPDVRRGDPVQLEARGDAFSISVDATAMEDASIGGRVRVSTGSKGGTLFAQVVDIGKVRLIGFK